MPKKHYRNSRLYADKALESCRNDPLLKTVVVHPVKANALEAVRDAVEGELIEPILVGPEAKIKHAADEAGIDISKWELIPTEHSHQSADKGCEMAAEGKAEAIMKGSLHSGELLASLIRSRKLRTERRISHAYVMDIRTYHKPFIVTDAAISVQPNLATKVDIVQNAINLWSALQRDHHLRPPKVALLAAVEVINPDMQATLDAASLCKMADRGQITGGILDGPLAFDNAISKDAAENKGIQSEVAGDPDILVAPDLDSANILGKMLTFLGEAEAAGIVLGARVPVILTSRADSLRTRLLSCALAVKLHQARQSGHIK